MTNTQQPANRELRVALGSMTSDTHLTAAKRAVHSAPDLDLIRTTIGILQRAEALTVRIELLAKYAWCEA